MSRVIVPCDRTSSWFAPRDKAAMLGVSTIEFFLEEYSRREVTRGQSPKVWRHKKIEFDKFNYGIFRAIMKEQHPKGLLANN